MERDAPATADGPRVLWRPREEDVARASVTRFIAWLAAERGLSLAGWEGLRRWSVDDVEGFWEAVWQFYDVRASAPYATVLASREMPGARWFDGARLNYAEQVLSRAPANGPAVVAVREGGATREVAREQLRGQVGALAAALRGLGVEQGDRVAAYVSNVEEALVALLAVTSLGAIWTACSPDFGTRSVLDRLGQVDPKVLIAVDGYRFNGKAYDRRDVVGELQAAMPSLRGTILVRSLHPEQEPPAALGGALAFDALVAEPREPQFAQVPFDHPLWILFSSGTTGLPKGIVHGHGGIVLEHLKAHGLGLDLGPGERFFLHTSTSWMSWNYLVGGLLLGASVVLYDGSPGWPGPDGVWQLAADTCTTVLGMGSAYMTGCLKAGVELPRDGRLERLRAVIPAGSPLPDAGWEWLHEQLPPRVRIDSLCGGTDVCTAFFGGGLTHPVHLGLMSCRWLGIDARAYDEEGRQVIGEVGEFVVRQPMPSMPLGFWNDPDGSRYRETYFDRYPGVWCQGDWITIAPDGTVKVWGRSDATLNRGGVRLGSADVYTVVEGFEEVRDSLVVGVELPDGEYWMPLFVVLADGVELDDALRGRIVSALRTQLSPRHVPDEIFVAPAVPRTLTGKKLEVPIKRVLQGASPEQAAASGALDDPGALAWFVQLAGRRLAAAEVG